MTHICGIEPNLCLVLLGGAFIVMVIVEVNDVGDPISNPGRDCLLLDLNASVLLILTRHLWVNIRVDWVLEPWLV